MRELKLQATQSNWRLFMVRHHDPKFSSLRQRIFSRDHHACVYCGFVASCHMQVVNANGDYRHNSIDNMVTACPLCAQCGFLETVSVGDYGGGSLIYLPDVTQIELNAMCHHFFSSMYTASKVENDALGLYQELRLRTQLVDQMLGSGMSQPSVVSRLLIEQSDDTLNMADVSFMQGLRLLPSYVRFISLVRDWQHAAVTQLTTYSEAIS